ncbi:SixA phosphatase family protein [Neorhizobium vignae]|uniref:SixA phosphatase family protein n=1 Tax=Neorhizobium vignae TaxID=690585 RepID=UPI00055C0949|nr:histidine phosphatase family protein [Neorhizobium vignae]
MTAETEKKNAQRRRLILLRHAKSAWPEGVAGEERPLAPRGRKAASIMAKYIAREKLVPDLVLVSPARRTQETWSLVKTKLPASPEVRDCAGIYEAAASDILEILNEIEPVHHTVLVIGHNPGLQELAQSLVKAGDTDALEKMAAKYPTAGLAVIDFDTEGWQGIGKATGRLERFVTPRSLD